MASRFDSLVHESWIESLEQDDDLLGEIGQKLRDEISHRHRYAPSNENIFRAFQMPIDQVKVLIVGQDPYPTEGHAVGWAFSVPGELRSLPPSLKNIFVELNADLGCNKPTHGDLSKWVEQGVLLLNRTLTVRIGEARSHYKFGWEEITLHAIQGLARMNKKFISILWGSDAHRLIESLDPSRVISSVHPSPLSAHRGFFGSKPFSRANALLVESGEAPIDWCLSHKEICKSFCCKG